MYYNQNDYAGVPYPRPSDSKATVKSGGCGVCCGSTVLAFFGHDYPPEKLAPIFIQKGARADSGTDMTKAVKIICQLGGLSYRTTSDEAELVAHLRSGGIAIANVGGDRSGWRGVFSTGGHYVVVLEERGGKLVIFDVGDYSSKYSAPKYTYRGQHVTRQGELLLCPPDVLHKDTLARTPNYYLIMEEDMKDEVFDKMLDEALKRRAGLGVNPNLAPEEYAQAVKEGITDGTRPQALVTRQEAAVMAKRAGK